MLIILALRQNYTNLFSSPKYFIKSQIFDIKKPPAILLKELQEAKLERIS